MLTHNLVNNVQEIHILFSLTQEYACLKTIPLLMKLIQHKFNSNLDIGEHMFSAPK